MRKQSETGCWCKRTCQRRIPLSEQSHPQFLFSGRAFDCRLHSAFPIRQVQLLQRQADLLTFCYNFNIFEPSESQQWILPVAIVTYVAFWLCENYNILCTERQGKALCSDCQHLFCIKCKNRTFPVCNPWISNLLFAESHTIRGLKKRAGAVVRSYKTSAVP